MALLFYTGDMFPAEYQGDALVTFHGSWNRKPPASFEIVRAIFDENGKPVPEDATSGPRNGHNRAMNGPTEGRFLVKRHTASDVPG